MDYGRLRTVTARELECALLRDGLSFVRQRGSHRRFVHPDGRKVTVPLTRRGDTFAFGTLKSIVEKQAKWSANDLERPGLLRP
ncbi:MAG: addiction module toxin, HicA family [Dehalococcoidia bacterium]|nr:addiction module toxin, HicA family [Dehalococcoidia bacterium]